MSLDSEPNLPLVVLIAGFVVFPMKPMFFIDFVKMTIAPKPKRACRTHMGAKLMFEARVCVYFFDDVFARQAPC